MSERKGIDELGQLCDQAINAATRMTERVESLKDDAKELAAITQRATDVAVDAADEPTKRQMIEAWREAMAHINAGLDALEASFHGGK